MRSISCLSRVLCCLNGLCLCVWFWETICEGTVISLCPTGQTAGRKLAFRAARWRPRRALKHAANGPGESAELAVQSSLDTDGTATKGCAQRLQTRERSNHNERPAGRQFDFQAAASLQVGRRAPLFRPARKWSAGVCDFANGLAARVRRRFASPSPFLARSLALFLWRISENCNNQDGLARL